MEINLSIVQVSINQTAKENLFYPSDLKGLLKGFIKHGHDKI